MLFSLVITSLTFVIHGWFRSVNCLDSVFVSTRAQSHWIPLDSYSSDIENSPSPSTSLWPLTIFISRCLIITFWPLTVYLKLLLMVGWLPANFWFANSPIFQKSTNLFLYSYVINYSDFIKFVHFASNQAFMKQLPLLSLLTLSNHSIDLFKLLPLLVSCPSLGLSLLLSSLNQSPDLIQFHVFQVPLFLFFSLILH